MLCCGGGFYPISQGEQHNLLLRKVPLEIVWRMDWERNAWKQGDQVRDLE